MRKGLISIPTYTPIVFQSEQFFHMSYRIPSHMPFDFRNLVLRFEEIKQGYARAKTLEEKRELLARLSEVLRQAETEIDRLNSN